MLPNTYSSFWIFCSHSSPPNIPTERTTVAITKIMLPTQLAPSFFNYFYIISSYFQNQLAGFPHSFQAVLTQSTALAQSMLMAWR
jgi:hypothetical protein